MTASVNCARCSGKKVWYLAISDSDTNKGTWSSVNSYFEITGWVSAEFLQKLRIVGSENYLDVSELGSGLNKNWCLLHFESHTFVSCPCLAKGWVFFVRWALLSCFSLLDRVLCLFFPLFSPFICNTSCGTKYKVNNHSKIVNIIQMSQFHYSEYSDGK